MMDTAGIDWLANAQSMGYCDCSEKFLLTYTCAMINYYVAGTRRAGGTNHRSGLVIRHEGIGKPPVCCV